MRPLGRLGVATMLAGGVLALVPGAARADGSVRDVGWWSQRPGAAAKGAGGVEVAWVAEQPQSVAAVHLVVPEGAGAVLLRLKEAGGVATDSAGIDLCLTTSAWTPANPGAFAARPTLACPTGPPSLGRDAAALEWTGDVTALLAQATAAPGDTVGIALVPRGVPAAAGLPVTTPFEVDLAGATLVSLDDPVPTAPPPSRDPGTVDPGVVDPGYVDPGYVDPGFSTPDLGGTGFDPGPLPEPPTTVPRPPTAASGGSSDGLVALGPVGSGGGPDRPWGRLLLLTPLSMGGGFAAAFLRRLGRTRLAPS